MISMNYDGVSRKERLSAKISKHSKRNVAEISPYYYYLEKLFEDKPLSFLDLVKEFIGVR